jgi:hypothetical protein
MGSLSLVMSFDDDEASFDLFKQGLREAVLAIKAKNGTQIVVVPPTSLIHA